MFKILKGYESEVSECEEVNNNPINCIDNSEWESLGNRAGQRGSEVKRAVFFTSENLIITPSDLTTQCGSSQSSYHSTKHLVKTQIHMASIWF